MYNWFLCFSLSRSSRVCRAEKDYGRIVKRPAVNRFHSQKSTFWLHHPSPPKLISFFFWLFVRKGSRGWITNGPIDPSPLPTNHPKSAVRAQPLEYGPSLFGTSPTSPVRAQYLWYRSNLSNSGSGPWHQEVPYSHDLCSGCSGVPGLWSSAGPGAGLWSSAGLSGTPLSLVSTLEDAGALHMRGQWTKCIGSASGPFESTQHPSPSYLCLKLGHLWGVSSGLTLSVAWHLSHSLSSSKSRKGNIT